MPALTPKQQRFIEEYLVDLNGTQAAIRAGYSERTANEQASRLLANVNVQAALQVAFASRSERTQITIDYVLERLRKESEIYGEGASHSARVKAIELLGLNLGLFKRKLELSGEVRQKVVEEVVEPDGHHHHNGKATPAAAGILP